MKFSTTLAAVASLGPVTGLPSEYYIGQTVQTSSGPVQGHSASGCSDVSEYLGIPFVLHVPLVSLIEGNLTTLT
jgi:hypothetical protein